MNARGALQMEYDDMKRKPIHMDPGRDCDPSTFRGPYATPTIISEGSL